MQYNGLYLAWSAKNVMSMLSWWLENKAPQSKGNHMKKNFTDVINFVFRNNVSSRGG